MFTKAKKSILLLILCLNGCVNADVYTIKLSDEETNALAKLVWQNEGASKTENLSVWNKSENFPSMGIGHFIWYPTKQKGPYIEQFPALLTYLSKNDIEIPNWLQTTELAPWKDRESFYADYDEPNLVALRNLLAETTFLQAQFITQRLANGIPAILNASTEEERTIINKNLSLLTRSAEGVFALLDYINFKGEGISHKEQYQGHGWGLKQVLLSMPEYTEDPLFSFALSADEVLTRRVKNAPRKEIQWLAGWRVRVHKYPELKL